MFQNDMVDLRVELELIYLNVSLEVELGLESVRVVADQRREVFSRTRASPETDQIRGRT